MGFNLSARSVQRLEGVPRTWSTSSSWPSSARLGFHGGRRGAAAERQRELVAKGASQTQSSLHLVAAGRLRRAVDLAPLVGGAIPWDNWESSGSRPTS